MKKQDKKLKVALVCDWLTDIGGAEQVLLQLARLFPDAPIYTSQYRPNVATWFDRKRVKAGSWIDILPAGLKKFISPLRFIYFSHLKLKGYDVVISVCNAEAKAVKTPKDTLSIAYLQGPPIQYYWGLYDQYIKNPGFGKFNWLARIGLKMLVRPMRRADLKASKQPDLIVANSNYVAEQTKKYYNREANIIYPPANTVELQRISRGLSPKDLQAVRNRLFAGQPYFVVIGRQVNWKRQDLAIKACGKLVENLLIIGDGAEHDKLTKLAKNYYNIIFLPKYKGPKEIVPYLTAAKGLIFPSLEPFGIAPIEALSCGCPVIAFKQGGAQDYIEQGKNGVLFKEQTVDSLVDAIKQFNKLDFRNRPNQIRKTANRFSEDRFKNDWIDFINKQIKNK